MKKKPIENCKNCIHFSTEKHKSDRRTQNCGICSIHSKIMFVNDKCNQIITQAQVNEIFTHSPILVTASSQQLFDFFN